MITACAMFVFALSTGASAQPPAAVQRGLPTPEFAFAQATDDDALEVRYFAEKEVFESSPGVAGKLVTHSKRAVETRVATLDLKHVVAKRVDGRGVTSQALAEELAGEKPVLLITEGQQIDPLFLAMFKPDTLVLQRPAPAPVRDFSGGPASGSARPTVPRPTGATPLVPASPPAPAVPRSVKPIR